jgi:acyl-CoA thioester hydrolase
VSAMADTPPETRADYRHFLSITTRWMDNDVYGHVNNVIYYAYFDTVINRYLITEASLDIERSATIGLCVESHCKYLRAVAFPDEIEAGLRVANVGRTSVRYEIGIFTRGVDDIAAHGWFVHVFVDRTTRRPASIPEPLRAALDKITGRG